jgi:hypothetical protein
VEESDRYLWDATGVPDAELQQWEELLRRFSPTEVPALAFSRRPRVNATLRSYWIVATAACLLVVASVAVRLAWQPGPIWKVVALSGTPSINGQVVKPSGKLRAGELLETNSYSSAKIRLGLMGAIRIEPNTRLRLVATQSGRHRVALERGEISAQLWAPPRTLSVDTPSSEAIDLGCAFVLQVDERGEGRVRVTSGWVQFQFAESQAIVPAGAVALTRPNLGPGTPFFEDARSDFRTALEQLDFGPTRYQNTQALAAVLAAAGPKDAISLLSLLSRVDASSRGMVFDKMTELLSPPAGLTREQVVAGTNPLAMDAWWKKLGLGDAKSWLVHWRDAFGSPE